MIRDILDVAVLVVVMLTLLIVYAVNYAAH